MASQELKIIKMQETLKVQKVGNSSISDENPEVCNFREKSKISPKKVESRQILLKIRKSCMFQEI